MNGIQEQPYFIFDNEVQTDEQKVIIEEILIEVQMEMRDEMQQEP